MPSGLHEVITELFRNRPALAAEVLERCLHLDMPEYKDRFFRLHAIYRTDAPPGPAGSWLIDRFVAQANVAAEIGGRGSRLRARSDRRKTSRSAR